MGRLVAARTGSGAAFGNDRTRDSSSLKGWLSPSEWLLLPRAPEPGAPLDALRPTSRVGRPDAHPTAGSSPPLPPGRSHHTR